MGTDMSVQCTDVAPDGTMRLVIVPDSLRHAIDQMLDRALADYPPAAPDRDHLYNVLLTYFDEHGALPQTFRLEPRP